MAIGTSDLHHENQPSLRMARKKGWEVSKADANPEAIEISEEVLARIPAGMRTKLVVKG